MSIIDSAIPNAPVADHAARTMALPSDRPHRYN